jgi:hypothetical protein
MATNTTLTISEKSQAGLIEFQRQCYNMLNSQWNVREQMRQIDLTYQRERDQTSVHKKSQLANRYGDANKFQNITIPVVLPAVEAAVTYQSSVFLEGSPIFGVVASPQFQDAAMQMEALMENHCLRGGWKRHIQMAFRDGFKYNMMALEATWTEEVTAKLDTDQSFANGTQGRPKEVIWAGNKVKRLDMYNTFWDNRVPITEVSEHGEFAGYTEIMSRIRLKSFIAKLPSVLSTNLPAAFASGVITGLSQSSSVASFYIPPINADAMINTTTLNVGTNWDAWVAASESRSKIEYKNVYEVTTLYARILPADFGLRIPQPNTPQIFKLIIINHQHIIYCERQTNAHNRLPILFGSPLEDGLSYQTKTLAQNVTPIQEVSSAMMNSVMHARRRAISDRGLFDPSRVSEANINSDNPSAKIPVRPAAYGKPLGEAYFPIPFRDDQSGTILQEMGTVLKLSDVITGQNPARQGQFVKGNKTRSEYNDVMGNSNGRDEGCAILLEDQLFTPLKELLKLNILQYQGPSSLYYAGEKKEVQVDPIKLREAVIEFKMTDGKTPASKQINGDALQTSLQVIGSSPQIGAGYNVSSLFSYLMKTQGANISDFEKSKEQLAYEQASSQWNQLAQLALSKGMEWKQPQPMPEQFGYLVDGQLQQTNPTSQALPTLLSSIQQAGGQANIGEVSPGAENGAA